MKVQFWGVRGSLACSGPDCLRYGGNTTCIAVLPKNEPVLILDAGTGIRQLGEALMVATGQAVPPPPTVSGGPCHSLSHMSPAILASLPKRKACSILLTHGHWDHIMGLPYFLPLYDPAWAVTIYAPALIGNIGLDDLMHSLFNPALFPVPWTRLRRTVRLVDLDEGQSLSIGACRVTAAPASHGIGATGYRIEAYGQALFFSGDHELGLEPPDVHTPFFQAMRGVDVAIVDAMYTLNEYQSRRGWGHSALEQWPPVAAKLKVGHLVLTHFNPSYSDVMLDDFREDMHDLFSATGAEQGGTSAAGQVVSLAYEGLELSCDMAHCCVLMPDLAPCLACAASGELSRLPDMSLIYDALLRKARALTHADAGTLYLLEEGRLVFAYSQNQTLYPASEWARQQYLNSSLAVDATSIAGFAALHGVALNIHNVRHLPENVPYTFNESFDNTTGYRTVSMCVLPLRSLANNLVGVIQLINCVHDGVVRPFTRHMQRQCERLCLVGTQAIERGLRVRDMILRMLQTAALRDPTETGPHVMRVGSMVAELYQRWAENRDMLQSEYREEKAQLRLAAMLHDIGKVGIPDKILKKNGRLDPEERAEMEKHAALGAQLFKASRSGMDARAREIALHHHQRWDGGGYTGDPASPPLGGEDIPLGARLTSVADVFDALVSPRCYKEPWPLLKAVQFIKDGSGTQFDPEVVEAFLEIQDTLAAIREKYQG